MIINPWPDPTNGQTQSSYSLVIADKLFECVLSTLKDQVWEG